MVRVRSRFFKIKLNATYKQLCALFFREFGDDHPRAIDETWYKSAVLQHQYDIDSFVYSVPLQPSSTEDLLITGSYAIFPKDAGIEAPASVVGFQFSHSHLAKSFFDIAVTQVTHNMR